MSAVITIDRQVVLRRGGYQTTAGPAWTMEVINSSGATLVRGDVVVWDRTNSAVDGIRVTTTTTANDPDVIGMVWSQTVAIGASCYIQYWGPTRDLKVDGTTDIAKGDLLGTFTTAKIAAKTNGTGAFARAAEAYATNDSAGVIDAFLCCSLGLFGSSGTSYFGNGTAALPSITFNSDTDSGWYRIGANNIGASVAGAKVLDVSATGLGVTGTLTPSGQTLAANGTAALPSLAFASDPDSGLYWISANSLGASANGALVWTTNTGGVRLASGGSYAIHVGEYLVSAECIIQWDSTKALAFQPGGSFTAFKIDGNGHFLAGTDNTYDIGASGATRPRNLYIAGTITAGGTITGTAASSITVNSNAAVSGWTVTNSNAGTAVQSRFTVASATRSVDVGVTAATTVHFGGAPGAFIASDTSSDLFFSSSASRDLVLTAGTGAVTIRTGLTVTAGGATITAGGLAITAGNLGIGGAVNAGVGLFLTGSPLTGAGQQWIVANGTITSAATSSGRGLYAQINLQNAAFTMTNADGVYIDTPGTPHASSFVTTSRGVYVANQATSKITNAYGVYIEAQSGAATANIGLYNAGTTSLIGLATLTAGVTLLTTAALTLGAGGNIVLDTGTGTKVGTATSQKLGFWNATPVIQATTAGAASTFAANTSLIANDTATWDSYTLGQVVKALRNAGILA
jgi:hypothetical protein